MRNYFNKNVEVGIKIARDYMGNYTRRRNRHFPWYYELRWGISHDITSWGGAFPMILRAEVGHFPWYYELRWGISHDITSWGGLTSYEELMTVHDQFIFFVLLLFLFFLFIFLCIFSQVRNIPERIILISTTGLRWRDYTHKHLTYNRYQSH